MKALLETKTGTKNYYRGIVNAAIDIFKQAKNDIRKMVGSKGSLDVDSSSKHLVGIAYEGVDSSDRPADFGVMMFYMPDDRGRVRVSWFSNGFKGENNGERNVDVALVSAKYIADIVKHEGLWG